MSEIDSLTQSSFFTGDNPQEPDKVIHNLDLTARDFRGRIEAAIAQTKGDIVITGHSGPILPDGDDIFSVLAMKRILEKKYPDKHPRIILSDRPIHMWDAFIQDEEITWAGAETVKDNGSERSGDLADYIKNGDTLLCLDQGDLSHFSRFPERLEPSSGVQTIIVDHHTSVSDTNATVRLREPGAAATAELIARMYPLEEVDPEVCALLYLGIASDTGGFTYRDYGDTKKLADRLLAKSGKTAVDLEKMIVVEPQIITYLEKFAANHKVVPGSGSREALPTVAYEYLSPSEILVTESTENPDFCLQYALRKAFVGMKQKNDSQLQFVFAPANQADTGEMIPAIDRYKIEFRRTAGETLNLAEVAKKFGGNGHQSAAGAIFLLSPEQLEHITEHADKPDFRQMDYVAGIILEKMREVYS